MVWAVAGLLGLVGCMWGFGDGGARLRGEILSSSGGKPCFLTLHDVVDAAGMRTSLVRGRFEVTFVLPPQERDYYVTVACEDETGTYRSGTLTLGSVEAYRAGVDLGTIRLNP